VLHACISRHLSPAGRSADSAILPFQIADCERRSQRGRDRAQTQHRRIRTGRGGTWFRLPPTYRQRLRRYRTARPVRGVASSGCGTGRKARDVSGGTARRYRWYPLPGTSLSRTHVVTRGYPRRPGWQARLTVIMIYVSNTGCMIFTHQGPNSAPLRHHGAIEPSDPLGYLLLLPSEARVRLTSGAS